MSCLTQHGVVLMVVLISLIAADVTAVAQWAEPANVLACRLADYREFQDAAWTVFESSRRGDRYLMYDLNAFSKGYWDRAAAYLRNRARRGIYPVIQFWGECYVEGQPDGENRWNVHPFNAEFMFSSVPVPQTPAPTCVGRGKLLWQWEFIGEPTRRSRAARAEAGRVCPPSS